MRNSRETLGRHRSRINEQDDMGSSVLRWAPHLNQLETLKTLLDHGVSVDCVDFLGRTAMC